jgi:hypothetical protein
MSKKTTRWDWIEDALRTRGEQTAAQLYEIVCSEYGYKGAPTSLRSELSKMHKEGLVGRRRETVDGKRLYVYAVGTDVVIAVPEPQVPTPQESRVPEVMIYEQPEEETIYTQPEGATIREEDGAIQTPEVDLPDGRDRVDERVAEILEGALRHARELRMSDGLVWQAVSIALTSSGHPTTPKEARELHRQIQADRRLQEAERSELDQLREEVDILRRKVALFPSTIDTLIALLQDAKTQVALVGAADVSD